MVEFFSASYSSEEEREQLINGDRSKRIQLDAADFVWALKQLKAKSVEINDRSRELNRFYYQLEELLRGYEIGYDFFLYHLPTGNADEDKDGRYRLCWSQEGEAFYFWRIGFGKLGQGRNLLAQKWRMVPEDPDRVGGPEAIHEPMGDPIRLTHAPRDIRTAAAHVMRDLLIRLLEQVKYNASLVDSALERVTDLEDLVAEAQCREPNPEPPPPNA